MGAGQNRGTAARFLAKAAAGRQEAAMVAEEARTKLVRAQERNARLAAARVWQQECLADGKSEAQGKREALPVATGVPGEKPEP